MRVSSFLIGLMLFKGLAAWGGVEIKKVLLDPLPTWARDSLYSALNLNIDEVMKQEGLTRFQAVEVQNRMRDSFSDDPLAHLEKAQKAYEDALNEIREGRAVPLIATPQFRRAFVPLPQESSRSLRRKL